MTGIEKGCQNKRWCPGLVDKMEDVGNVVADIVVRIAIKFSL